MSIHGEPLEPPAPDSPPGARLFVHEPGWRVTVKRGSEREYCYAMAPGQDYYHRLLDGEIVLHHDPERLCLACASRRGLVTVEPRRLPEKSPKFQVDSGGAPIAVLGADDAE